MTAILYPAWYDENRLNKYPFEDSCSLKSTTGKIIPNHIFLDAAIYVIGSTKDMYLRELIVSTEDKTITINLGTKSRELCSGSISVLSEDTTVNLFDSYDRPCGVLVIGNPNREDNIEYGKNSLRELFAWGAGTYKFTESATKLVNSCVHPLPNVGFRGIVLEDGELFSGDVWLVGERGVILRKEDDKLRVDIIGTVFSKQQECNDTDPGNDLYVRNVLQTINEIGPNENCGFILEAVGEEFAIPVISINQDSNSILLSLRNK